MSRTGWMANLSTPPEASLHYRIRGLQFGLVVPLGWLFLIVEVNSFPFPWWGGDSARPRPSTDESALLGTTRSRTTRPGARSVMGFVAATVGFTALGAYLGRDLSGATGLLLFIGAFACIIGLNIAAAKGREQLRSASCSRCLLLGLAVAPVIADYADADLSARGRRPELPRRSSPGAAPTAMRRAETSPRGSVPCSGPARLIVFGIVAIFVSIRKSNLIDAVAGLGISGVFTIFRLQPPAPQQTADAAVADRRRIFLDSSTSSGSGSSLFGGGGSDKIPRHTSD